MRIDLRTPTGVSVLLIDDNQGRKSVFEAMLTDSGYAITASVGSTADLVAEIRRKPPDVVLINDSAPEKALFKRIEAVDRSAPRPIVLFSEDDRPETIRTAVSAGVNAYVVVGLNTNRVRSAIDTACAHFADSQALKQKLSKASEALAERKIIEKAKGLLMKQRGLGEEEAYASLRKTAMERNVRLVDLARTINDAAELLI